MMGPGGSFLVRGLRIAALRHFKEAAHDVPKLAPVRAERDGVCSSRKHDKLAIRYGQSLEEIEQVVFGGDTVKFAARNHDGDFQSRRIDERQLGLHIEITSGGNGVSKFKLCIRHSFGDGWVGGAGFVASED